MIRLHTRARARRRQERLPRRQKMSCLVSTTRSRSDRALVLLWVVQTIGLLPGPRELLLEYFLLLRLPGQESPSRPAQISAPPVPVSPAPLLCVVPLRTVCRVLLLPYPST